MLAEKLYDSVRRNKNISIFCDYLAKAKNQRYIIGTCC